MVSRSRVDQSTLGWLQGGISFLQNQLCLVLWQHWYFFSYTVNEINCLHLFLLLLFISFLFTGHHRGYPGWEISWEIMWDCYAGFSWKQWEKCFGHFVTRAIEARKRGQAWVTSWIEWNLGVNSLLWVLKLNKAEKDIIRCTFSTNFVTREASGRVLHFYISQEIPHNKWWKSSCQ